MKGGFKIDNFKKVCEFIQGVTPAMTKLEPNSVKIVDTKKDNHHYCQTVDDCLVPRFLEDTLYKKTSTRSNCFILNRIKHINQKKQENNRI